jgi:hypothetical protein
MRDFFYNKRDVLIAMLIILAAARVIYTRVGVIMDYPSKMAGGEGNAYLPPIQDVLSDVAGLGESQPNEGLNDDAASAENTEQLPADVTPAQTNPAPVQTDPAPADVTPPEAAPPAEVTIIVSAGDVASVIADKLLAAGAIPDKAAFLAEVTAQSADSKLKMGTFTIPAGATPAEIVRILVG